MPIDLTSLLKEWGATVGLLSVAATCLLFLFALSMREFFYWFLKLNKIVKNQEQILQRLAHLESLIEGKTTVPASGPTSTKPGVSPAPDLKSDSKPEASREPVVQFPINAKQAENSAKTFLLLN